MTPAEIARYRLANQQISWQHARHPAEVVAALGAMQAQDYLGALWAVGLRMPGKSEHAKELAIEKALAERSIIRSWPMRGTLHLVAAADIRWILELLTPRMLAAREINQKRLELNEAIFVRCRKIFTRALEGGRQVPREDIIQLLEKEKISTDGMRGYHIFWRLALEGLICFAGRAGKQQTFALLHEWAPQAKSRERASALKELASRYFTGHGPATLKDFIWWSGLRAAEARQALESAAAGLIQHTVGKTVYWMSPEVASASTTSAILPRAYLLPGFDEYILGYNDRTAVLAAKDSKKIIPGNNGVFANTLVLEGQVVGIWRRELKKDQVMITASPFATLKKADKQVFDEPVAQYGQFLGLPVQISWV